MTKTLNRRLFLGATLCGLATPALMNATRVNASEVEVMAGKLLIPGFPGSNINAHTSKVLAAHIRSGRAGGALFLRHNVKEGGKATRQLAASFIDSNRQSLIAIDQEGGKVQRLGKKHGLTPIPAAYWVANNKSVEEARILYNKAGRELRSTGFNLNMAPSVDIHDPANPVIGKHGRGFSANVERISDYAGAFIDGFASAGVACSIKHFPGHGSSRSDSHDGFVDITDTWSESELLPFHRLADKAPVIMGGHIFHPKFSNDKSPVTFSRKALSDKLRKGLGYHGVIVTDDLDMGAIRKSFQLKEAIILALAAGNDLLLLSNSLNYDENLPADAVGWIRSAVKEGLISQSNLKASFERVMRIRKQFSV